MATPAASQLSEDPWARRLVASRRLVLMPMTNAIGYTRRTRDEMGSDPNRDFPFEQNPFDCMTTVAARSVNEVFRAHLFQLALTYHGGMEAVGYVWGNFRHRGGRTKNRSPDDAGVSALSNAVVKFAGNRPFACSEATLSLPRLYCTSPHCSSSLNLAGNGPPFTSSADTPRMRRRSLLWSSGRSSGRPTPSGHPYRVRRAGADSICYTCYTCYTCHTCHTCHTCYTCHTCHTCYTYFVYTGGCDELNRISCARRDGGLGLRSLVGSHRPRSRMSASRAWRLCVCAASTPTSHVTPPPVT